MVGTKRTPTEWSEEYGLVIHDPDGWRMPDAPKWTEPITREDFESRMSVSTIQVVDRNKFGAYTSRY